jgi:hypothetical protein
LILDLALWALVLVLAGWGALLWYLERQWRPLIRGYLERRVGQQLPDVVTARDQPPSRSKFPVGDNVKSAFND